LRARGDFLDETRERPVLSLVCVVDRHNRVPGAVAAIHQPSDLVRWRGLALPAAEAEAVDVST
jgi:hypothetical protein